MAKQKIPQTHLMSAVKIIQYVMFSILQFVINIRVYGECNTGFKCTFTVFGKK